MRGAVAGQLSVIQVAVVIAGDVIIVVMLLIVVMGHRHDVSFATMSGWRTCVSTVCRGSTSRDDSWVAI